MSSSRSRPRLKSRSRSRSKPVQRAESRSRPRSKERSRSKGRFSRNGSSRSYSRYRNEAKSNRSYSRSNSPYHKRYDAKEYCRKYSKENRSSSSDCYKSYRKKYSEDSKKSVERHRSQRRQYDSPEKYRATPTERHYEHDLAYTRQNRSRYTESISPVRNRSRELEYRKVENYREKPRGNRVKESLEKWVGKGESVSREGSMVKMDIVVPRYFVSFLTGKNGESLKVIERRSKCIIRLDTDVSYYKHNRKMKICKQVKEMRAQCGH
eukprot:TRINITY_DN14221_c0_g1_i6.p1 TRINITY_DN14221_c0_g1~~TRINITY_DN14221_c0_g1_i6.p1  ORF type:complete len:266 (+),score=5.70 TRINITY_DN14221_c0_g1_i6:141-938(+)